MSARVLMVDDIESNLFALEAVLHAPDVMLVRARSGHEALTELLNEDFAVVVLDVQMPELDGFATATLIRQRPRNKEIPIIFLTAHSASDEMTAKAYAVGAVDFVTKPFEPRALRAKVTAFVDASRRVEEVRIQAELAHQQRLREERQRWEAESLRAEITAERRAAEEERAARRDAETANKIKDEFLATLSHELRTPLNAILGWVSILKSKELDREARNRGLSVIERNARLQAKLIEDMLDISRIVAGKLRIEEQEIDLAQTVERIVDSARPAAEAKEIGLQIRIEEGVPRIAGDPDRLSQVLANLLSNAVKFTSAGGRVDVRLGKVGDTVQLRVEDTGKGIAREFLPHVFDRFRQGDGATTRSHGGLGIGLSIARYLVELHGGTIEVESDGPGQGTRFVVSLPIRELTAPASEGRRPIAAELNRGRPLDSLRVLIVDDEPEARELLQELLELEGAEVLAVESAAAAMAALAQWRPTVLVSDVGMPVQDGYGLIQQVRRLPEEWAGRVPAIALTAYASVDDVRRAREAGFQVHLAKPVDPPRLIAAIAALALARGDAQ